MSTETKELSERKAISCIWHQNAQFQASERNWNRVLLAFTIKPEQHKFVFKSQSLANSLQKCVSVFFPEMTFLVQMFDSPTTSCKTVKCSLQTHQSIRKNLCSMKRHQQLWLMTFVINWKFDVQNNATSKTKNKQHIEILTQGNVFQEFTLAKTQNNWTIKNRKWLLHQKTQV